MPQMSKDTVQRYLVYDIEIVKGIPARNEAPLDDIEYCKGWHDHEGMGISVIGAYDTLDDRTRVFCADNIDEFVDLLEQSDVWISFNGVGFDNKVIRYISDRANDLLQDHAERNYDILREIWVVNGLNPDKFYWKTHGGFGLNDTCLANGLQPKTGHGALAPVDWQRGNIGTVIDYCVNDVKMTLDLFDLSQQGPIKSPKGGDLELRRV